MRGRRAEGDDPAVSLLEQSGERGTAAEPRAAHADVEDAVEVLDRHLVGRADVVDSGGENQRVEPAERERAPRR